MSDLPPLDELTRKRLEQSEPDYYLVLDIKGWRKGHTDMVRWVITPLDWGDHIDPDDNEYLADILEKVIYVMRLPPDE